MNRKIFDRVIRNTQAYSLRTTTKNSPLGSPTSTIRGGQGKTETVWTLDGGMYLDNETLVTANINGSIVSLGCSPYISSKAVVEL